MIVGFLAPAPKYVVHDIFEAARKKPIVVAPNALSNRDDCGACRGPLQRLVIPPLVRAILFCHRSKTAGYPRAGLGPDVIFSWRFRDARFEDATSTAARRLDCSDVDLFHLHHRLERALGGSGIGIGYRLRQSQRRNLPGHSPFVLAPAARTLFAAVANDGVPVTIRFGLVNGGDLKRECFVVLERGSAIEAEAGNAHHGKLDRHHIPFLPGRKVSRGAVRRADG